MAIRLGSFVAGRNGAGASAGGEKSARCVENAAGVEDSTRIDEPEAPRSGLPAGKGSEFKRVKRGALVRGAVSDEPYRSPAGGTKGAGAVPGANESWLGSAGEA